MTPDLFEQGHARLTKHQAQAQASFVRESDNLPDPLYHLMNVSVRTAEALRSRS